MTGLNLIRLILASGVIVLHAIVLNGHTISGPYAQMFAEGWVDGFFAVSGFLIVGSWLRRPQWWEYLTSRALRIFPAFWVCLVVTAFVLAPVGVLLSAAQFPAGFLGDQFGFVSRNFLLYIGQYDIAGTPNSLGNADPGWNGSLWTLFYEFVCYFAVLAAGVVGALRWKGAIPAVFAASIGALAVVTYAPIEHSMIESVARFAVMFSAGALVYGLQHRLPVRLWTIAIACGALVVSPFLLDDYRLVAALPFAYLLIAGGALIRVPALTLKNDISYGVHIYGFPIQQILVVAGVGGLGIPVFALLSALLTAPLAIASWFVVEKPSLRLKQRTRRRALTVQEIATS